MNIISYLTRNSKISKLDPDYFSMSYDYDIITFMRQRYLDERNQAKLGRTRKLWHLFLIIFDRYGTGFLSGKETGKKALYHVCTHRNFRAFP